MHFEAGSCRVMFKGKKIANQANKNNDSQQQQQQQQKESKEKCLCKDQKN